MRNSAEVSLRESESKGMTPEQAEDARKITMRYLPVAVAACTEDEWSLEARQCLVDVKVDADQAACEKLITAEQRQSFERRMESAD